MLKFQTKRFHFQNLQSPTLYNIHHHLKMRGWKQSFFKFLASFTEKHLAFDEKAAQQLEYKHLFAELMQEYCPEISPETFCINDENWQSVHQTIAKKYPLIKYSENFKKNDLFWILKPSLLNNGQHIKIFQSLDQLSDHYLNTNRLGGEHVLQKYINPPHLIGEYKYTIRMFVVLTNYAGAYLYPHGYFNLAKYRYQPDHFNDLRPHLTNEHLQADEANVIQIPSDRIDIFKHFYPNIKDSLSKTYFALTKRHPDVFIGKKARTFAIFGFDFLVDDHRKLWLLEANHGPCFPVQNEHPLQKHLYFEFWNALIDSFVLPIANGTSNEPMEYRLFVPL